MNKATWKATENTDVALVPVSIRRDANDNTYYVFPKPVLTVWNDYHTAMVQSNYAEEKANEFRQAMKPYKVDNLDDINLYITKAYEDE